MDIHIGASDFVQLVFLIPLNNFGYKNQILYTSTLDFIQIKRHKNTGILHNYYPILDHSTSSATSLYIISHYQCILVRSNCKFVIKEDHCSINRTHKKYLGHHTPLCITFISFWCTLSRDH